MVHNQHYADRTVNLADGRRCPVAVHDSCRSWEKAKKHPPSQWRGAQINGRADNFLSYPCLLLYLLRYECIISALYISLI